MKTVYFVRHGQTESNFLKVPGRRTDPLSERGQLQAELVASRLTDVGIEAVVSSPYVRAHQTAERICTVLARELILDPILEELKGVSALGGISREDPDAQRIRSLIRDHMNDAEWHYADEENFIDAKKRSQAALNMLLARPEQTVLAVTHGAFLQALIRTMLLGNLLTPELYLQTYHSFGLSNAGITVCKYKEERGWQLMQWNDIAHLSPDLHTY